MNVERAERFGGDWVGVLRAPRVLAFDPDQPRDEHGQWSDDGIATADVSKIDDRIKDEVTQLARTIFASGALDDVEAIHVVGSWAQQHADRKPDRKGDGTSDIDLMIEPRERSSRLWDVAASLERTGVNGRGVHANLEPILGGARNKGITVWRAPRALEFNPDQPRDDQGQWTDGSASQWASGAGVTDGDVADASIKWAADRYPSAGLTEVRRTGLQPRDPLYSGEVGGLRVRTGIPNTDSISATFSTPEYDELRGIRAVPLADLDPAPFGTADDQRRTQALADAIRDSGEINPLIVVVGGDRKPYVLEGGHRVRALQLLGVKAVPALVIVDHTAVNLKAAGGAGSGWTAENGHVPGSQGGLQVEVSHVGGSEKYDLSPAVTALDADDNFIWEQDLLPSLDGLRPAGISDTDNARKPGADDKLNALAKQHGVDKGFAIEIRDKGVRVGMATVARARVNDKDYPDFIKAAADYFGGKGLSTAQERVLGKWLGFPKASTAQYLKNKAKWGAGRSAEFNPDQARDERGQWAGGDTQTFFHGTADRFVEKIRAEGLKSEATRSDASSDFRVYMTPDRALAVRYAKTAAALGKSIGTPVLIQIRVPAEHAAKIGLAERQPTDGSVAVTYPTDIPPSWIVGVEIDGETGWRSLATGGRTIWAVAFIKEPRSAEFNPDQPRDEHGQWTDEGVGANRTVSDAELRRQAVAASAAQLVHSTYDENPARVRVTLGMTAEDRVALMDADHKVGDQLHLRTDRYDYKTGGDKKYDAFVKEAKAAGWSNQEILDKGIERGLISREKTDEFKSGIGSGYTYRMKDVLGGLDAQGRDRFETALLASTITTGNSPGIADLVNAGWTEKDLERFADKVQASGGRAAKRGEGEVYRRDDKLAGKLAFHSKDYESFRTEVYKGWSLAGDTAAARTIRAIGEQAYPQETGQFYHPATNENWKSVWGSYDPNVAFSPRAVENMRALKAETDAFYRVKNKGVDKPLDLVRGVGGHSTAYTPGSIESWTTDKRTAARFGKMMSNQKDEYSTLSTRVTHADVLWSWQSAAGKPGWPAEKDLKGKKEFVILGSRVKRVEVLHGRS